MYLILLGLGTHS